MTDGLKIHVSPVRSRPCPLPLKQQNKTENTAEIPASVDAQTVAQDVRNSANNALTNPPRHYGHKGRWVRRVGFICRRVAAGHCPSFAESRQITAFELAGATRRQAIGLHKKGGRFYIAGRWQRVQWRDVPSLPGVYAIYEKRKLVYIGQSEDLRDRLNTHSHSRSPFTGVGDWIAGRPDRRRFWVKIRINRSRGDHLRSEYRLIARLKPPLNSKGKEVCKLPDFCCLVTAPFSKTSDTGRGWKDITGIGGVQCA